MGNIEPRRLIQVDSRSALLWHRAVYREYADDGGMIHGSDWDKNALLVASWVMACVNGKSGICGVSVRKFADWSGYIGGGHDMHDQCNLLLNAGFLTRKGFGGRGNKIAQLMMSVPVALAGKLEGVKNCAYKDLLMDLEDTVYYTIDVKASASTVPPTPDTSDRRSMPDPWIPSDEVV